jgi:hypothetical protein
VLSLYTGVRPAGGEKLIAARPTASGPTHSDCRHPCETWVSAFKMLERGRPSPGEGLRRAAAGTGKDVVELRPGLVGELYLGGAQRGVELLHRAWTDDR